MTSIPLNSSAALDVSVVMAVYNGMRFIGPQLQSLLADLRPDDEVVVVDDASTDETPSFIASIGDARVRYCRNERNLGVRRSFEKAIGLARHPIICLCDQDDVWVRGKRQAVVTTFENDPGCVLVIHDAQVIDAQDAVTSTSFMQTRGGFNPGIGSNLLRNKYLGCAMSFRARLRSVILPIPATVPMHDMWIGLLAKATGSVAYLPSPYLLYRRHGGNVSPGSRAPLWTMLKWRWQLAFNLLYRLATASRTQN
ncbi:MAG: alpha-L-Rha alpha-1,3-L-rhamnosyltransferase [Roseateles depolymerans]|uniref:Alpha-L-Rha alpha-1,3-L-rhamnosyltransferase n=1 Tax=Roseateles depolymerans TaxID=76731 RepID=A0A2W5D5B6_9BURK|nr:MAG: alpha-L-Rha alpha-1,3-L-rhamnosyltransferase [Roseateles depolymerans]